MSVGSVLVVNDVEINLIIASELLRSYGLTVDTAGNGFSALSMIEDGADYNIIFMDNKMPEMDGFGTTHKIRELGFSGKIVMLSGDAVVPSDDVYGDFDEFLLNPIDTEQLERLLNKLIPAFHVRSSGSLHETLNNRRRVTPRLMQAFERDAAEALTVLQQDAAELSEITAAFHSMKTALANIGRTEQAEKAYDLERAGLNGNSAYIARNLGGFVQSLQSLVPTANRDGKSAVRCEQAVTEDTAFISEKLQQVRVTCDEYDIINAERLFSEILSAGKPLKSDTRELITKMRDLIYSDSDFDRVDAQIAEFLSKQGGASA
jgi:CheY-like chemotaxis protein